MPKSVLINIIIMIALLLLCLMVGAVEIPFSAVFDILCGNSEKYEEAWSFIILNSRLPAAITALLCGISLSVSGLLLQTVFQNPLAGPSVFGINSGASLAVSMLMLTSGGTMAALGSSLGGQLAIIVAACFGAGVVMLLILGISSIVRSNVMLLIIGMMIGYLTSSATSILSYFATEHSLQAFTIWGLGTFANTTTSQLPALAAFTLCPTLLALLYIKPLNALLLGDNYAANLGYSVSRVRNVTLIISSILSAIVTAFCGPISFLGLAIPHIARLAVHSDDHLSLLPATILIGGNVALLCNLITILPSNTATLPINAITPLIGAPIIMWIILRK